MMDANIELSLVIGADGSLTRNGSSREISSTTDRQRFLALRRECDVIMIGGSTARSEPYERTPVPLIILSRLLTEHANPKAVIWQSAPREAIARAVKEFGTHILIEGGPRLFRELLPVITRIHLTITDKNGDTPGFNWKEEFLGFSQESYEEREGENFLTLNR
jgi:riboflavin biosynthesis pyrimidine reductase